MNERIEALLIEAHRRTKGGIYNGHISVWTEKFAELLIEECILMADDFELEVNQRGLVEKMKHRFGVKE